MGTEEAVNNLTAATKELAEEVKIANDNSASDRKILVQLQKLGQTLKVVLIGKAITIALILIVAIMLLIAVNKVTSTTEATKESTAILKDCIDPTGVCAKRGAASTGELVINIGKLAEVERLTTEIQCGAQVTDDRVGCLKRRLAEEQAALLKAQENIEDIRNGRPPRNK